MNKKPSLADALARTGKNQSVASSAEPTRVVQATERPLCRRAKKLVSGHFDAAVSKQLKMIGLEHDMSLQQVLAEAFNDLFRKHGMSPIA